MKYKGWVTTIALIRHAQTQFVGNTLTGRTPGIRLNGLGRLQAAALAERLRGAALDAIFTSPLERAQETAAVLQTGRNILAEVREGLTECEYGAWSGRTFADLQDDSGWQRFNVARSEIRPPGGETAGEVQQRIVSELNHLADKHPSGYLAVVSHLDVLRAAIAYHLQIPLDRILAFDVSPASLTHIEIQAAEWRLRCLNDTSHLEQISVAS